jgi:hypothetical protein
LDRIPGKTCDNVKALRDEDELHRECIPWLDGLECQQVTTPGFALDASCTGQLLI